jgi:1,4-alpha-glucan branching enzyme
MARPAKPAKPEPAKAPARPAGRPVTFSVRADGAREVVVTGDFTGWAKDRVKLTKNGNGEWHGTLQLAPGEYQYRLLVDGEWRDDPKAQRRIANPFGTQNCVLSVS